MNLLVKIVVCLQLSACVFVLGLILICHFKNLIAYLKGRGKHKERDTDHLRDPEERSDEGQGKERSD